MPSTSRIIISAAGGGKTTRVVDQALANSEGTTAIVTYTRNNVREIRLKALNRIPVIPANVEVVSWYSFLLRELARPYRSAMHKYRIDGFSWSPGKSVPFVPESNTSAHYFFDNRHIYSDKIAKFVCECDRRSGGAIMRRLRSRYSHLIFDEIQDVAGYDLDLLELILRSDVPTTLVGDHRQATLSTHNASKNKAFAGPKIIKKFEEWSRQGLITIVYERDTFRCNQHIADLGDSYYPNEPKTISRNTDVTGHDGVFLVASKDVDAYVKAFSPQLLRYSTKTKCGPYNAMNFGESKGLTFDRALIFPHGKAAAWITSGETKHIEKSIAKMYVAVTRARYSVAFVFDGKTCGIDAQRWHPVS